MGEIPAGKDFNKKLSSGSAVRIFTGAPVPKGSRCCSNAGKGDGKGWLYFH